MCFNGKKKKVTYINDTTYKKMMVDYFNMRQNINVNIVPYLNYLYNFYTTHFAAPGSSYESKNKE